MSSALLPDFLESKRHSGAREGFEPVTMPGFLFDFQRDLVGWAVEKGRAALFADCGMGKTPMQLVWADNVAKKTGSRVLVLTPLAVGAQTVAEAHKFGIDASRSLRGELGSPIVVANYERLHLFDPKDFAGVVCDESSILKSFDGSRRGEVTEFMKRVPYRLLCTATAAPNDYIELGTSSEALGGLGHIDMLNRFFKNDNNNTGLKRMYGEAPKWRFKGHAELPFWRWVCSWARAVRKPSDIGYDDGAFVLPQLVERQHLVLAETVQEGRLFDVPASTLPEQREEKKRTVRERCEKAAALVADTGKPAVLWCQMNAEGDLLEKLIPGAVQVSGKDSDESKESKFAAFASGEARVLVTKPRIGAWGLNWQHCSHVVYFPSHSYEEYYQAVRRCWRFGQKNPVTVDVPLTEGERAIMANLVRKSAQAERMFASLVSEMTRAAGVTARRSYDVPVEVPAWLA
jgi:hypothetical protein